MPGINYQALYDLSLAGDPRAAQAARNLTPEEGKEFFDFQQSQVPMATKLGLNRKDNSIFGIPPELLALGPGLAATKAGGVVATKAAQVAKDAWPIIKGGAVLTGIGALPISSSAKTALEMMYGFKTIMGGGGAPSSGAGTSIAVPKGRSIQPAMSDADYFAQYGKPRLGSPNVVGPHGPANLPWTQQVTEWPKGRGSTPPVAAADFAGHMLPSSGRPAVTLYTQGSTGPLTPGPSKPLKDKDLVRCYLNCSKG